MMRCLILFVLLASALRVGAVEIDGVAAHVGSETILRSDVLEELRRMGATDAARYNEVRNELIDRKLILKAAAESKMTMQEWVVDNRVREIIGKAFDGDRNKLIDMLGKQKVSFPEWRARMKEDMVIGAMRWNVVDKNVTASPAAMMKEFEENPDRYAVASKVTISAILLKPEDAGKREEISAALAEESFADLARKYSVDAKASEGGQWKDIVPEDCFRPEVCKEIAKMPKGTISHWLELDGWSYLLRKDDATEGQKRTFAEAYDDIEANVKEAEAKRLYDAWLERLRAETYIKVY